MPELMSNAIVDCLPYSAKPVLAFVSPHAPELTALSNRRGVPAFGAPESCGMALAPMYSVAEKIGRTTREPLSEGARDRTTSVESLPVGSLDEVQAKRLFANYGVRRCMRPW